MIHILGMNKCGYDIGQDKKESFEWYTELGWEVVVGRLEFIRRLNSGKIQPKDIVYTLQDRMFMYTKLHPNVQPWVMGIEPVVGGIRPACFGDYGSGLFHSPSPDRKARPIQDKVYRWKEQDLAKILDHDYEDVNPPPCVIINHRVRGWYPQRNISEPTTQNIVSVVLEMGLKPYISGMHAENIDPRAEHIPSLRKVASIMHHPNCKAFIGSGGPSLLAQQCHSNKLIFLNTCGSIGVNVLFLQDRMNFAGHKMFVVAPNDINRIRSILLEDQCNVAVSGFSGSLQ